MTQFTVTFTREEIDALNDAIVVTWNEGLGLPALEAASEKLDRALEKENE